MTRVCACLLLAAGALPAADARGIVNKDLPEWLTIHAQARFRAEGQHGIGFRDGNNQDFLLHRYRFGLGIQPLRWLHVYGELQDARVAGIDQPDAADKNVLDVRQAFVVLGSDDGLWDLKVGRQRMAFGTERIIGGAEWGNTSRVFDAIRLALHRGPDRVDIFSSSVVNNHVDEWDHHQQGNNLHGFWASIGSIVPGGKIEPFLLMRTQPRAVSERGIAGKYHSWTYGARAVGKIGKNWLYEGQLAGQRGMIATNELRAWAAMGQVRRLLYSLPWKPSLIGELNYGSGDGARGDGRTGTWDQLYPTNHGIYGVADQASRRNIKQARGGVWFQPRSWLTLKAEGHSFWLASRFDAYYAFNGPVAVAPIPGGAAATHIGKELDLVGEITASPNYTIGAQFGHMAPGDFIRTYTPGASRTFYAVYLDLHI